MCVLTTYPVRLKKWFPSVQDLQEVQESRRLIDILGSVHPAEKRTFPRIDENDRPVFIDCVKDKPYTILL